MTKLPGQRFDPLEQLFLFCPIAFLLPGRQHQNVERMDIIAMVPAEQGQGSIQLLLTRFPVAIQALQITKIGKG